MNDVLYVHAREHNDLFLLNINCNDLHIHNIDAKRCNLSDDSDMYMWHCRLGHIRIKHMKKLRSDGILESLDFGSLHRCEPFIMDKMTWTPFSGVMEWVADLLGIILASTCVDQ
jgi:hypothetical protein